MKSEDKSSSKFNSFKQKSTFRPSSANFKKKTMGIKVSSSIELPPPIIFTLPTNNRKTSGMGNNIEREQLYENNIQLKETVNKLRKELAETKYLVVKKDIELRDKEKIIRDCLKENDIELDHENNLEKAKESSLLTLCKQKYYSMKKNYIDKCQENDILKANIKITKIKEFQIENDILNKELEKLKSLYQHCKTEYENSKKEINGLQDFKSKFLEQHIIINTYMKKNEENNQDINKLKIQNENLKNEIEKMQKKQKKLKVTNCKLKINNDKYMNQKKMKENFSFNNTDNLKKISDFTKEVFELKRCILQKDNEIRDLKKIITTHKIQKENLNILKPFDYKTIKSVENTKNNEENIYKIELYKSLLDDIKMKNAIYENFLKNQNINPELIIKDFGYNGIINTKIRDALILQKNNSNNQDSKTNLEKSENINNDNTEQLNKEIDNNLKEKKISSITNELNNNTTNENTGNNVTTSELTQKPTNNIVEDESQFLSLLHLFVKNMESNHVTQEMFQNKLNEIIKSFDGKNETSKQEFLEPFINMFIDFMKLKINSDIEVVKLFFNGYIDKLNGDTSVFYMELTEIFKNIQDYTLVKNEEELLNHLAIELQKHKNEFERDLNKEDVEKNHIITFDILRKVIQENKIIIDDDLMEYLIYKMKISVPDGRSMFDLNYEIILDLLKKVVSEHVEKKEDEKKEDVKNEDLKNDQDEIYDEDMLSAEISNKLSIFKNNLTNNNTDLEKTYEEFVQKLNEQGKSFEVIEKNKFFEIMEKYNVTVSEEVKYAIGDLFKADPVCNKGNNNVELMDFRKLKQLFSDGYYKEE